MKTQTQPVIISGQGGAGGDLMGPTIPGKPSWYSKYLGGSGGDWDLHFPGAKRIFVTASQFGVPSTVMGVQVTTTTSSFVRIMCRNFAGNQINGGFYFVAQVWY